MAGPMWRRSVSKEVVQTRDFRTYSAGGLFDPESKASVCIKTEQTGIERIKQLFAALRGNGDKVERVPLNRTVHRRRPGGVLESSKAEI